MLKYFNEESIKSVSDNLKIAPRGFKYCYIADVFKPEIYEALIRNFPDVGSFKLVDKMSGGGRKRFYTGPLYDANKHKNCVCHFSKLPKIWQGVVFEAASPEFINLLKDCSGIRFNSICTFGFAYGNEGCMQGPHIDGAVREYNNAEVSSTIACLLYFNRRPEGKSGTCVYDVDRKTKLFQVENMRNGLFFFEQHSDAWHGFPVMEKGEERRLVSLAFSQEGDPFRLSNSFFHKATCILNYKSIVKRLLK